MYLKLAINRLKIKIIVYHLIKLIYLHKKIFNIYNRALIALKKKHYLIIHLFKKIFKLIS